jgi:autotransporter-associated beta strand protein
LRYTGGDDATDRGFSISSGQTGVIEITSAASSFTFAGGTPITYGSFTKMGPGALIFTGAQANLGTNTITEGRLQIGNGGTTGSLANTYDLVFDPETEEETLTYTPLVNNGNFAINRSNSVVQGTDFSSVVTGTGSVTILGSGVTTLNAANTYSGGTTVTAGKLLVNNSTGSGTGSGTVSVLSGATLGGSGTIGGTTTVQSGGVHSPGNSPGIQTFTNGLTYAGGSVFNWELSSLVDNSDGTRGTHFDGVNLTTGGELSIASDLETGAIFKIVLGVNFVPGSVFWDSNHVWSVFNIADPVTLAAGSDFSRFLVSDGLGDYTSDYSSEGYFTFDTVSGSPTLGNLNWTAVPEPTGALAGLLVGAGLLRRRRSSVGRA